MMLLYTNILILFKKKSLLTIDWCNSKEKSKDKQHNEHLSAKLCLFCLQHRQK